MAIRTITAWLWQFHLFRWPCIALSARLPQPYASWFFFETPLAQSLHALFIESGDYEAARKLAADMRDYDLGQYDPARHA